MCDKFVTIWVNNLVYKRAFHFRYCNVDKVLAPWLHKGAFHSCFIYIYVNKGCYSEFRLVESCAIMGM